MKIAKWVGQPDGGFAWVAGDRTLATVYARDGGWRTSFMAAEFPSAHDACLAAERFWPPLDDPHFYGWLESKNGGYFRKSARGQGVYVRKADNGWYAVGMDGKVLGKGGSVSWFATALDACGAVDKAGYTPAVPDPFVNTADQWRWIKLKNKGRAA